MEGRRREKDGPQVRRADLRHDGADSRKAALHCGGLRGNAAPRIHRGHRAVPARAVRYDVRRAPVDGAPVRRILDGGGIQRLLPPQPRCGPEGAFDSLRPRHPQGLRLRPPARRRRRRQGGRGGRLHNGHGGTLRQNPALAGVGLDDYERRGSADSGVLHRRRPRTGSKARTAHGHHTERHSQRVHGAQHLHLSAGAVHAHNRRHLRVHLEEHAEVQQHLDFRLPHAGSGGYRRPRNGVHARRRARIPQARRKGGA